MTQQNTPTTAATAAAPAAAAQKRPDGLSRPGGGMSADQAADRIRNLKATASAAVENVQVKTKKNATAPDAQKDKKDPAKIGRQPDKKSNTGKTVKAAGEDIAALKAEEGMEEDVSADDGLDPLADSSATEGEDNPDSGTETDEDSDASEEGTEGAEGDEDADGDLEEETLHTVVVDGKSYEVTYEELLSGYSRTAHFHKKMQELSEQKKEIEAIKAEVADLPEKRKTYEQGAERFAKNAHLVFAALQNRFMPQPPNIELAKTDPAGYLHQKEMHQEALQFLGGLQQEMVRLEQVGRNEHKNAVVESRKKLYEVMPEMQDAQARQKLRSYAHSLGFTDEQMANEANHVLFVLTEKARRYDELQSRKSSLREKKHLPKVQKRTQAMPSAEAVQQKKKQTVLTQHKREGSIKSAESAISAVLNRRG